MVNYWDKLPFLVSFIMYRLNVKNKKSVTTCERDEATRRLRHHILSLITTDSNYRMWRHIMWLLMKYTALSINNMSARCLPELSFTQKAS